MLLRSGRRGIAVRMGSRAVAADHARKRKSNAARVQRVELAERGDHLLALPVAVAAALDDPQVRPKSCGQKHMHTRNIDGLQLAPARTVEDGVRIPTRWK